MKSHSRIAYTHLSPWSRLAAIGSIAFGLVACGDTINEQINANVGAVKTSDDLPECTEDIAGQTAFIKETHEFLGCDGKEWQTLSANTVSVGDNVCTSTSLSDGTGFEIFCNGASIGTVKNGKDGTDGKDGEPGAAGKDGAPGEKGDTGAKGDKGDDGAPGTNGTNGTNGKDGANGTGCKIQESTALTATIACGSETFTMDFKGYVDVPEECDTTDTNCAVPMEDVNLSGVSQKGPFVSGTDVTAYELENGRSLKQTGKTFGGKIENKDGSFNIRTVKLKSSFAYLVADGFYRNEVTGRNSSATIKLRALTNLDGRSTANINLVTHLEYDRVQRLVTKENKSVIEAKRAAEKSLFAAFNIDNTGFKGFAEDLNIFKEGDGNAALLAVSAMLQGDRNESELTALLASFSVDLGDNGVWDDSLRRAQIADWAMKTDLEGRLATIRANVEGWKLGDGKAPAFEGHVTNFWMKELDVGECNDNNEGKLFATKNKFSSFYAANDSAFTEGDSSLVRLICAASGDSYAWRYATDIEKDTAALARDLPVDTAIVGVINTAHVYVKEEGTWRRGTQLDLELGASCVASFKKHTTFSAVSTDTTWYICVDDNGELDGYTVPTSWRKANEAEADTAQFGIPESAADSIKRGHINKGHYFVYEDGWRRGTEDDYLLEKACIDHIRGLIVQDNAGHFFTCTGDTKLLFDGVAVPTTWRASTADEADTLGWSAPSGAKDSVRQGNIDKTRIYVYEDGWRRGTGLDNEDGLGGCIQERVGSIRQRAGATGADGWYKCVDNMDEYTDDGVRIPSTWRRATDFEVDMLYWKKYKNTTGALYEGPITGKTMVWDADTLRQASETEIKLGRGCVSYQYGDSRLLNNSLIYTCSRLGWSNTGDFRSYLGQNEYGAEMIAIYKGVLIGGQTWMVENLGTPYPGGTSSLDSSSFCYGDTTNSIDRGKANCDRYGRLYLWSAAMDSAGLMDGNSPNNCGNGVVCTVAEPVRGICPEGWHLPSKAEWETLIEYVGGTNIGGGTLKSRMGWDRYGANGTDDYFFSALPAGEWVPASKPYRAYFHLEGRNTSFWTSTQDDRNDGLTNPENNAYVVYFGVESDDANMDSPSNYKSSARSVRCISDIKL